MVRASSSIKHIVSYIRSDPESWRGIAFAYMQSDMVPTASADALIFKGQENDFAIIGSEPVKAGQKMFLAIEDIASKWQIICGILDFMDKEEPCSTNQALPSLSILVVEDDPMPGKMVAHHLQQFGTVTT